MKNICYQYDVFLNSFRVIFLKRKLSIMSQINFIYGKTKGHDYEKTTYSIYNSELAIILKMRNY
jgi:hypothetical protein